APSAKGDDKFITTDYLQQCPFYPITFYPITIQTLTIMIIVHIVKSEGEGALTPYKGSAWKTDFPTSRELS
ncbi:TPA: hypothetical protein ACT2MK_004891, partial [Escherichia coli]